MKRRKAMGTLSNKVAVVTGGSSGIGLATARRFIADGAQVVVTGRNLEALDGAVAELGDRATGIQGDVANLEDLDRLFAQVREQFGRVDVLFAKRWYRTLRWLRLFGRSGGSVKVYSGCHSCRQNPFASISLPLLLRLWGCGQGA